MEQSQPPISVASANAKKQPMETLDSIEARGKRGAEFSIATLKLMTTRANALLTLLQACAGGIGQLAPTSNTTN